MKHYFSELVKQSVSRATESTLSILGISDPALRTHLSDQMRSDCGANEAFLAPPLFEHTFGWEFADVKISDLKSNLLSEAVINALNDESNGRYRFEAQFNPFKHQLIAWKTLLSEQAQSVVVTSGTGSGKTECFMVPVLEDLYREFKEKKAPLVGVRALFLYPLNALINSQQERLDAWTKHFGNGIRYCLYNGNTENSENKMRKAQLEKPNEVLSRELMRKEPAPILVTNGTMLEYMLVRQIDASIIERSRQEKSLRWIVLDEAHSYIGSQAAELALQLRRVLQAFGVDAKNVRFVATSATIAGADAQKQLTRYLADLAGVEPKQIKVIGGRRVIPEIDFVEDNHRTLDELIVIDPDGEPGQEKQIDTEVSTARFSALAASPIARTIRDVIVSSLKPLTLDDIKNQIAERLQKDKLSSEELLRWFDLLTGTKPNKYSEAFLKVRAHFFQRMTHGLWSCIDKNCRCKKGTSLEVSWPFGNVYSVHRQHCECGAPVLELTFCMECNEPHLFGRDKKGVLTQWTNQSNDEFSLLQESVEEGDSVLQDVSDQSESSSNYPEVFGSKIDEEHYYGQTNISFDGVIGSIADGGYSLTHSLSKEQICCECSYSGYSGGSPFRRAMLGAPFYIANVVPTMLEFCPDYEMEKGETVGAQSLPARGRRLITFTDSRQGTARLSVRMQQEAERSKLRGAIVEVLIKKQQDSLISNDEAENIPPEILKQVIHDIRMQAEKYRKYGLGDSAEKEEQKALELEQGVQKPKLADIGWDEMVRALAAKSEFKGSMLLYNQYMSPEVFRDVDGSLKLADMLLFREFSRRPKRQNNCETQGLIKIGYSGLELIKNCPENWQKYGFTLQDWLDFIKVALDFYVRENNFLRVEESGWLKWIGSKFASKDLINPESEEFDEGRIRKWPQIKGVQLNRLIKLLSIAANVDASNNHDKDVINSWLKSCWQDITKTAHILEVDDKKYALNRKKITFSLVTKAFVCPITNKLIDTTFKGVTPYLPRKISEHKKYLCQQIDFPELWDIKATEISYQKDLTFIREQVEDNSKINALRAQNLWTDINDRAVEGGFYYRTAEHSAQQSAERLNDYEDLFKKGKINVLNCSTTMEMGVDIGGIAAVVMNNVPPHPANYLQRAGRAGRSKESRAISYTLCKDNPHDQQVFHNPKWPFVTLIPAPYVAFNSERLVQRHVNSFLLAQFLKFEVGSTSKEKTSLNLEWFYLPVGESICERFLAWLSSITNQWDTNIQTLVRGTVLANTSSHRLRVKAFETISKLKEQWIKEYTYLQNELATAVEGTPYAYRMSVEKCRLGNEYLLRELAAKSFLPSYGFPTDVVNFDNNNIEDFLREKNKNKTPKEDRDDNVSRYRGLPSRNLAVGIREYAPGADIVLDGRVFRSGGVSLHWHNVTNTGVNEAQKFDFAWRCDCCGQTGYEIDVSASMIDMTCSNPECGALIKSQHIRKVLQPAGFVTDFYHAPTNDISSQKFIPVEPAWVSVGNATPIILPNNLGYMASNPEGTVFQHSSGVNGKGYALCMVCGKAESMTKDDEFPRALHPSVPHRPLKVVKKDQKGEGLITCEGSGALMPNVHLGCHTKTDVFELVLKHPVRNEYIFDNPEGLAVSTTLAVALRSAIADVLGISTSELGYAVRPAIVENSHHAMVIQIYDSISGGAGFASSANHHIQILLSKMINNLHCDKCESACSDCLLESDTRFDINNIDRILALKWLGNDFTLFNRLPPELTVFIEAQYQPYSLEQSIRYHINQGAQEIILWLDSDSSEWDLAHPLFKRRVINYLHADNLKVRLVIPGVKYDSEMEEELWLLQKVGVELCRVKSNKNGIAAQLINCERVTTIATSGLANLCPGEKWHSAGGVVVSTTKEPLVQSVEFKLELNPKTNSSDLIHDSIEVDTEFNGKFDGFGQRFWMLLIKKDEQLTKWIANNQLKSINYSDRYIQSPQALLFITQIIGAICQVKSEVESIRIETLFHEKDREGRFLHNDWGCQQDFIESYEYWLEHKTKMKPEFVCNTQRSDIAHRRKLTLEFASGEKLIVKFDQGVGYWKLKDSDSKYETVRFDFAAQLAEQLSLLQRLEKSLVVKNSEEWSTDITYKIM